MPTGYRENQMVALDPKIERPRLKKLGVSHKGIRAILCLANVNPVLAEEWHPTKNGSLTPWDVTTGSNLEVWWLCEKCGYEWKVGVGKRVAGYKRCIVCLSLQKTHPKIASEWHPTKNGDLTPYDVTSGTKRKVHWKCKRGHEWYTRIDSRTQKDSKCSKCPRIGKNSISLQDANPELASEWDYEKNSDITPKDVAHKSNKKVWWKCAKKHSWRTRISDRVSGNNCPYCTGRRACVENSLQTINPELAKEWHPTKNGKFTPSEVTYSGHKKVWWLGKCGHEWEATVANRNQGSRCPHCLKERRTKW